MNKKIQVIETLVYEYEPDLSDIPYQDHEITSIEGALALDEKDYNDGKVSLEDLCYNPPQRTAVWKIIDE